MGVRRLLPPGADVTDREAWLAARQQGVTASEIAVVLDISPFDSPFNLYWKKRGVIPEDYDDDRLSLGRHMEPWVAERFAKAHPEMDMARGSLFQSVERPWQLATPDYLLDVPDEDGKYTDSVLEIKTSGTYEGWGEDGTDDVPAYIAAQVRYQMDVIDCRFGYVACIFLATQQIRTYRIGYDAADVELMRARAAEFLQQVKDGTPPPIDDHVATTTALKRLYPDPEEGEEVQVPADLAARYRTVCQAVKDADARKTQVENEIRAAMGSAKVARDPAGLKVASRSVYDRKPYTVGPARIDRLNPTRTTKKKDAAA